MSNELIKVTYDNNRPTVLGRELHERLEIATPYSKWFARMCEYGFTENVDFATVDKNVLRADGTEMPQTQHDHQLTIEMAKEICMIQRSEIGKKFRQYFIDLGGTQTMTLINESGLYSLILSSKLPAAKKFKRWAA